MEHAEPKRRLRAAMARRRSGVDPAQAQRAGEAVARALAGTAEFAGAARLGLYAALPGELPTAPLVRAAREAGKSLLWPRVTAAGELEFAPCPREEDLVSGRLGVRVPPERFAATRPAGGDLVVVPGLAFDAGGGRLGRGGGYYDRAFPPGAADAPLLAGVGHAFQVVDAVPRDSRDRRLDLIVTEAGVLRCAPQPPHEATGPR